MPDSQPNPSIFVVSDATAETAERTVRAALIQFRGVEPDIRVFSLVRTDERLDEILRAAANEHALVLYTIVHPEQRELLRRRAEELKLMTVDLIGQLMAQLGSFFGRMPAGRPGIPRLTDDYFRRIEAVEFAVKHDDGQAVRQLHEADIVLVGISRTSKTPLSTYLAQRGWKVANVPLVLGLPLPKDLDRIGQDHIFGLTIDVASLIRIRRARLKALNMPVDTDYARREHIIRELEYGRDVFRAHPQWPVIDVSQKAIEETAAIILRTMDERRRGGDKL
ncbi:MAG: kinase/pyrophosphorylase [Deltaproteobacteria bacterium]|nr:kinase/pyrophosphorylase [Deltaproteobacteria bacterium]MCB9786790.1 kinase/pyrophosphorylase [Deltaproteobacteria bacterium]